MAKCRVVETVFIAKVEGEEFEGVGYVEVIDDLAEMEAAMHALGRKAIVLLQEIAPADFFNTEISHRSQRYDLEGEFADGMLGHCTLVRHGIKPAVNWSPRVVNVWSLSKGGPIDG